ncbi:MAG: hypothetical protein QG622_344 [Actinomycetota bacterium]|nr:hypothetical protein [Actinomycetota bacterium]
MSGSDHAPVGVPHPVGRGTPTSPGTTEEADRWRPLNTARALAVPVLVVAVLAPYALALSGLWTSIGDDLDATHLERSGVVAFRPLIRLIAATANAQSTAVAGDPLDVTALRAAMAETDSADAKVGGALGMDRRWTDVRSRLEHLISSTPTSSAAYTSFSQVIDLENALLAAVVDSSRLRVDPQLDVHYLVEAAGTHVPEILLTAGRINDLTLLVERRRSAARADTITVVVAQSEMRQAADRMDNSLRKGFDTSSSRTLGPALLRELDKLRDAIAAMAPPMQGIGSMPDVPSGTVTKVASQQLRGAAIETETAALDQLDDLLRLRAGSLSGERRTQLTISVTGLVLAVVALVLLAPGRRRATRVERIPVPMDPASPQTIPPDGPARSSGARHREPGDLLGAHELFEGQQMIKVGRTITSSTSRRKEAATPSEEDR